MVCISSSFLFLVALRMLPCSAAPVNTRYVADTLKGQLDWICSLKTSLPSEDPKEDCDDNLLGDIIPQPDDSSTMINEAIKDVETLRKLLLKELPEVTLGHLDVSKIPRTDIAILLEVLPSMYDSLVKLHDEVKETMKHEAKTDNAKMFKKLTEGVASGWLTSQGFNSDNININTTLEDLNNKLTEILTEEKPLYKLPSLYATYYMKKKPENTGERLSWLLLFSASLSNNKIEDNLREHVKSKLPRKADELVSSLKSLSHHNGPIMNLIGTGSGNSLYPFSKMHSKPGKFADPTVDLYLNILADLCDVIEEELKEVEKKLAQKGRQSPLTKVQKEYMNAKGFDPFGVNFLPDLSNKIKTLVGKRSALNKVCTIVKSYDEKANPKSHNDIPSKVTFRNNTDGADAQKVGISPNEETSAHEKVREGKKKKWSLFKPSTTTGAYGMHGII
ncbi:hypothetical protein BgAZ_202260 [Babesia gibsoni]|uniref:WSN domain-containing protein n=1 Tax=Babesia gibsoni TaxID=33632 RepID=A0AAD8LSU0_BABGI|nr:hypothetical protein BgAZ_202260 [Babesia gibsoni]